VGPHRVHVRREFKQPGRDDQPKTENHPLFLLRERRGRGDSRGAEHDADDPRVPRRHDFDGESGSAFPAASASPPCSVMTQKTSTRGSDQQRGISVGLRYDVDAGLDGMPPCRARRPRPSWRNQTAEALRILARSCRLGNGKTCLQVPKN